MSSEMDIFEWLTSEGVRTAIDRALLLGALVTARIVPIIQLVPYFGGKATPQTVKMGLALALTILIYPMVWSTGVAADLPMGTFAMVTLLLKEIMLGVTFGFVAALVFEAVRVAGQLIDNARGQTMATALAPQIPERVSISSDIMYQLTIVTFLALGGHRLMIGAVVQSFAAIPPHKMPAVDGQLLTITDGVLRLGADAITLGVLLAFPVTAAILLTELCLAMVNRAAPQINVFFLGMPLKAMLGIGVLLLVLHGVVDRAIEEAIFSVNYLDALMRSLSPGAQ